MLAIQEGSLNCCRFSIGVGTVVLLVALRVGLGWHFFSQGVEHYRDPGWSSEGFLRQAKGPWADFYKSSLPGFHGFNELVAHPWREIETAPDKAKATDAGKKAVTSGEAPKSNGDAGKPADAATGSNRSTEKKNLAANAPTEGNPQPSDAEAKKAEDTKQAKDAKAPRPPTEGEPSPPAKKEDPATKRAEEKLAEDLALAHPIYNEFAKRVINDWNERGREIAAHYGFDDKQKQQANAVFERYKQGLLNYLAGIENDLYLYQRELRRLDAMQSFQGASQVPFASKRVADKQREVANQPAAWLADFRRMEREFEYDIASIATPEQKKLGRPRQPDIGLKRNDRVIIWALMICGGCLIVGLFTRLAAIGCAAFLFLVMMTQPPWVPWTITTLFPYQLVEMLALLALATTTVGRWGGLDFFLHFLITAPFRRQR